MSAKKDFGRKRISAEQDYLSAKQALAEAGINTHSAEQQLYALGMSADTLKGLNGQSRFSYTRYELVAPFDGAIIDKHITLGETVKDDASCFTIADLNAVWVNLSVYQKDLPLVQKGQEVIVSAGAEPAKGTHGVIEYVGPVMGEDTRTATARLVLPNTARQWKPGQFVTGFVSADKQPVPVLVAKTALQNLDSRPSVFVQDENGFAPTAVTVGRSNDTHAEIVKGLTPGQKYASAGSFIMKAMLEKGELHDEH